MRVVVSEQGYAGAVGELVSGNQYAAHLALTHADRLRGTAAMAGDDSTAEEFAASYDEAATESLAALASLVDAFAALARLVEASLTNHATAETRAALPAWARSIIGPPTLTDQTIGVRIGPPPSSLGTDQSPPGGLTGLVLDQLHDVFWPNADTDRVRTAGTTWHTTAQSLTLLRDHLDRARTALEPERSPEIPLALTVLAQLRTHLTDLTDQLAELGAACTDYADHVETKRAELLDLLEDLVIELGLTALAGGTLSFLSAGTAAGAAGTLGATRLATATTHARHILDSLRLLTTGTALRAQPVATTANHVTATATRITRARVILMEAGGRGGRHVSRPSPLFEPLRPGWLRSHESPSDHAMRKHVGLSDSAMADRLAREQSRRMVSSFTDQPTAERAIEKVLRTHEARIKQWLDSPGRSQPAFEADVGETVGRILFRGADEAVDGSTVRVVLRKDESMPDGWRVKTSYINP